MGFDIPRGKVTARQALTLNEAEEEMLSTSDVAKMDDIKLQEITKMQQEVQRTEDLIEQLQRESSEDLPM